MQLYNNIPLPSGINENMYYLNNHMYYVESSVELLKIYSSIEHQSAGTYP